MPTHNGRTDDITIHTTRLGRWGERACAWWSRLEFIQRIQGKGEWFTLSHPKISFFHLTEKCKTIETFLARRIAVTPTPFSLRAIRHLLFLTNATVHIFSSALFLSFRSPSLFFLISLLFLLSLPHKFDTHGLMYNHTGAMHNSKCLLPSWGHMRGSYTNVSLCDCLTWRSLSFASTDFVPPDTVCHLSSNDKYLVDMPWFRVVTLQWLHLSRHIRPYTQDSKRKKTRRLKPKWLFCCKSVHGQHGGCLWNIFQTIFRLHYQKLRRPAGSVVQLLEYGKERGKKGT